MKLAFSGQGRYPDFDEGYELYKKKASAESMLNKREYRKVVKEYCKRVSDRLLDQGMADLPSEMGTLFAATITRKPQYRGKQFVGYGKMDWKKGHYDGKLKAFGMVYLPRRGKNSNMRSFGFVANRQLFRKMKEKYDSGNANWMPLDFTDEMI